MRVCIYPKGTRSATAAAAASASTTPTTSADATRVHSARGAASFPVAAAPDALCNTAAASLYAYAASGELLGTAPRLRRRLVAHRPVAPLRRPRAPPPRR